MITTGDGRINADIAHVCRIEPHVTPQAIIYWLIHVRMYSLQNETKKKIEQECVVMIRRVPQLFALTQ